MHGPTITLALPVHLSPPNEAQLTSCPLFMIGCREQTDSFTEHIDLFPTLVDAAMGKQLPPCPDGQAIRTTRLCK